MSAATIWIIGLFGPVVAFHVLGVASFVWMMVARPVEEPAEAPADDYPRGPAPWVIGMAMTSTSFAVANALLAPFFAGRAGASAIAGFAAGAAVSPLLVASLLVGFLPRPILATPFIANLAAMWLVA